MRHNSDRSRGLRRFPTSSSATYAGRAETAKPNSQKLLKTCLHRGYIPGRFREILAVSIGIPQYEVTQPRCLMLRRPESYFCPSRALRLLHFIIVSLWTKVSRTVSIRVVSRPPCCVRSVQIRAVIVEVGDCAPGCCGGHVQRARKCVYMRHSS